MRVSCTYDEEYPGEFALWQANCRRSRRSAKGRAALEQLERALTGMPVKKLGYDILVEPSGEVCAIGAQMVQEAMDGGMTREKAVAHCAEADEYETQEAGERLGMPKLVAWAVAVENDDCRTEKPEERYTRILAWVQSEIAHSKNTGTKREKRPRTTSPGAGQETA